MCLQKHIFLKWSVCRRKPVLAVPCGRNGVCRRKPRLAVCMWLKWSVVTGRFSTASHTQP